MRGYRDTRGKSNYNLNNVDGDGFQTRLKSSICNFELKFDTREVTHSRLGVLEVFF